MGAIYNILVKYTWIVGLLKSEYSARLCPHLARGCPAVSHRWGIGWQDGEHTHRSVVWVIYTYTSLYVYMHDGVSADGTGAVLHFGPSMSCVALGPDVCLDYKMQPFSCTRTYLQFRRVQLHLF